MTELRHDQLEDDAARRERERLAEEVRRLTAEIEGLNVELAETNKGVVALYAELDDKAEQLRHAGHGRAGLHHLQGPRQRRRGR